MVYYRQQFIQYVFIEDIAFFIIVTNMEEDMNFLSLLGDAKTVPDWVRDSFPIIQSVLMVLVTICAVVIIVAVLMQTSNADGGSNAITGTNESYYGQNKGGTKEGRLKKLVIIAAVCVLVMTLIYFITFAIYRP